jgi:PBP1b-binding outer membrane lipoprotein LpoB
MKTVNLSIIAFAAAMLAGCSFGGTNDEPVTADPVPVTTSTANPTTTTAAPGPAKPEETIQVSGAHIDASAFLNALVDSGCQIDNAEYKEVKRGGAIKVVCAKSVDALNVELEDL